MIVAVQKLEKLSRECVRHGDMELFPSNFEWSKLKEIEETLEPAFIDTKKLQTSNLTLSDIKKIMDIAQAKTHKLGCLLYTSPSPRDRTRSRMPSSA